MSSILNEICMESSFQLFTNISEATELTIVVM